MYSYSEQIKRCEEISGQKFCDMWIGRPAVDTLEFAENFD